MNYKLINPEYLESVTGGDISVIAELINMFKEQIIEFYEEMKSFYSKNEYRQLGMLAHKAKSSVAIMGMDELAGMLKTFELSAKENQNIKMYESYINKFYNDTNVAIAELDKYLNNKSVDG